MTIVDSELRVPGKYDDFPFVFVKMDKSEEIEFEDDVKPPPPPLGFEKAIDILSAWIHKKFFSESSESSTKSGSKEGRNTTSVKEVLNDTIEGSEESKSKTSTPERKNISFKIASTSKIDNSTFDDYEVAEENESYESYQEKLLESNFDDCRREIIKQSRHLKANPTFISDNPEERADIDDPRWEEIKKLKNDRERKAYAMREFGNVSPADPTKCLTYYGFLRSQKANEKGLESPNDKDYIRHSIRIEKGQIHLNKAEFSKGTSSRKRKANFDHEEAPDPKRRKTLIPMETFAERLEHIAVMHKQKLIPPKDLKYFLRHWRYDLNETISFYSYYDEGNANEVDVKELDKSDCIEFLHRQFTRFYGTTKPRWCRECSYEDERNIVHCL